MGILRAHESQPAGMTALAAIDGGESFSLLFLRYIIEPKEFGCMINLADQPAHFADPELDLAGKERFQPFAFTLFGIIHQCEE